MAGTLCLFVLAPVASADNFSQAGSQNTAARVNNMGSDDSLEASTNSAMMAMMNLSALNIPGAFSNGYRAYGQYLNSETMDDLEANTQARRNAMASVGNAASRAPITAPTHTSFSRLKPDFLYKGETAEVAAEFERRSGLSRKEFLRQLGDATDSDLTFDDPNLMQKLEARFQSFTNSIPNPQFKKGLETAASMLPTAARAEAISKLAGLFASNSSGRNSAILATAPSAGPSSSISSPEAEGSGMNSTGSSLAAQEARAPASVDEESLKLETQAGIFIGMGQNDDAAKDLLAAADAGLDGISIFEKVTRRYRVLTPGLLGKR